MLTDVALLWRIMLPPAFLCAHQWVPGIAKNYCTRATAQMQHGAGLKQTGDSNCKVSNDTTSSELLKVSRSTQTFFLTQLTQSPIQTNRLLIKPQNRALKQHSSSPLCPYFAFFLIRGGAILLEMQVLIWRLKKKSWSSAPKHPFLRCWSLLFSIELQDFESVCFVLFLNYQVPGVSL